MSKSLEEKLEALEQKKARLQKQEQALKEQQRKKDTHNKIVLGGAVLSVLGRPYQDGDEEKLIAFLRAQENRGNYFSTAMNEKSSFKTE